MASFNDYRLQGFTTISNTLLKYYSQLKLSETELVILLELELENQKNNYFPSNQEIASRTNLSSIEISQLIQELIEKNIISLGQNTDKNGKINNFYDLTPLYNKLDKLVKNYDYAIQTANKSEQEKIQDPIQLLIRQFEIEFGRLLSPIERQEVAAWINVDHYDPDVVKMALREAILSQVYNFKYVDRILLNWQRHSLKSPDQIKKYLMRNE